MPIKNDVEWAETRTAVQDPSNPIAIPIGCPMYLSTHKVIPYEDAPAPYPAGGFKTCPSIYVEAVFRNAPVKRPEELTPVKFLVKCLTAEYMESGLDLLGDEGLFTRRDGDGNEAIHVYRDRDELQEYGDELVRQLKDDPTLTVTVAAWEWLADFQDRPADSSIAWFSAINLFELTQPTNDLSLYVDLAFLCGPRSTEAIRIETGSQFHTVVRDDSGGGMLLAAINTKYHRGTNAGAALSSLFLRGQVPKFLLESRWPPPYGIAPERWEQAAFDLPRRAMLGHAGRTEWCALVLDRLRAVITKNLPTIEMIMRDVLDDAPTLVREVQNLGDLVLDGKEGGQLVFWKIKEVEAALTDDYQGMVKTERDEDGTTETIVAKLRDRLRAVQRGSKAQEGHEGDGDLRGPKPGQVARATAQKEYTTLEVKHFDDLQQGIATDKKLTVIRESLTAPIVVTHAVLFDTKGARLVGYIGPNGSEYLNLLYAERHLVPLYLGQSLAYDDELGRVPKELRTFRLPESEWELLRNFQWDEMDPLNKCILLLRAQEVGTIFHTYSVKNLYHDGDLLRYVEDLYGKLYEALGFPPTVEEEEGLTFRGFMKRIMKIQKFAMALATEEQRGAHALIDDLVKRGYLSAAANAKRIIYGPSPADRCLRAWVQADDTVVIELVDTIEAMTDVASFRRKTGSMFTAKAKAAAIGGLTTVGTSGGGTSNPSNNGTKGGNGGGDGKGPGSGKAKGKGKASKNATTGGGGKGTTTTSGKAAGGATPGSGGKTPAGGVDVNFLKARRIYLYADGTFSVGTVWVNWPEVCKHFSWDPKLYCGPVVMSGSSSPERACGHGCAKHVWPKVNGQTFKLEDHRDELNRLGLTGVKKELQDDKKANKPPPGVPKKVGTALVYPARHFA